MGDVIPTSDFGFDQNREFVELFTKHQKRIFAYILSLVSNHSDAEDLLQQTAGDMWKMFSRFTPGTNFLSWAFTIAKFRVLKYRREQNNKFKILDDALFQTLSDEFLRRNEKEDRHYALEGCLERLSESERTLLKLHYEEGQTYKTIADKFNYAQRRIYSVMSRIHISLHDCILQTLIVWRSQS